LIELFFVVSFVFAHADIDRDNIACLTVIWTSIVPKKELNNGNIKIIT